MINLFYFHNDPKQVKMIKFILYNVLLAISCLSNIAAHSKCLKTSLFNKFISKILIWMITHILDDGKCNIPAIQEVEWDAKFISVKDTDLGDILKWDVAGSISSNFIIYLFLHSLL